MPKNWLNTNKLLENEFLCDALRGRITYNLANPMVRALAYYDRRVGKRTLQKLDSNSLEKLPEWTVALIRVRLEAEGLYPIKP